MAAHFAEDYCLLLYDKRGHGLSDLGTGPVTIDRHVDDLLAIVDHFDIERMALVGLSIGGQIAQRMAVRAPERLAALVLCDTAAKIGDAAGWNSRISAIEKDGLEAIGDSVMERWFTPEYRAEERLPMRVWRNMLVRQSRAGYAASCAAIRDADLTADAAKIAVRPSWWWEMATSPRRPTSSVPRRSGSRARGSRRSRRRASALHRAARRLGRTDRGPPRRTRR